MARLPLIAQSVRRKRIGIALTIWLEICRIAIWFLFTMGASLSLHTYKPRIRSYTTRPDRNQGGSSSSRKKKKNSTAGDNISSSFNDAATLLAENMRAIDEQISRSIASDVVVQQKSEEFQIIQEKATNLYSTLCEVEGLSVDEWHRALSKIPDHPTQMLVFFSLPSEARLEWVRRFVFNH